MKNTSMVLGLGAAVVTMALYSACSDDNGTPAANGDGGPSTTGGSTSVSTEVTGGSTSTDTSAGGTTTATGGSSAAAPGRVVINSFDSSAQVGAFAASTYVPTDCGVNLGAPNNDAGGSLLVEWSGSVDTNADSPNKGSMKVTAVFTGWSQYWELDMAAPTDSNGNPLDLTNKLVTAQIKILSGLSPDPGFPDGATLFVKTGTDSVWGASEWTNVDQTSSFVTLTLDATNPQGTPTGSTWDPKQPTSLGIKLSTGSGESTYCGGSPKAFGPAVTTVAYIDDIIITDRP